MEFKVIKLDRKRNNVVLSRRAVVDTNDFSGDDFTGTHFRAFQRFFKKGGKRF